MVKDSIIRVLGRFGQESSLQMMTETDIFEGGSPFKWVDDLERFDTFSLENGTYRSESLSQLFYVNKT